MRLRFRLRVLWINVISVFNYYHVRDANIAKQFVDIPSDLKTFTSFFVVDFTQT